MLHVPRPHRMQSILVCSHTYWYTEYLSNTIISNLWKPNVMSQVQEAGKTESGFIWRWITSWMVIIIQSYISAWSISNFYGIFFLHDYTLLPVTHSHRKTCYNQSFADFSVLLPCCPNFFYHGHYKRLYIMIIFVKKNKKNTNTPVF